MIDTNKRYRTRDGRDVRIYAVDAGGIDTVHGAILHLGSWSCVSWDANGNWNLSGKESSADLIEVQPERWHPIYALDSGGVGMSNKEYSTRAEAMNSISNYSIAIIDAWLDPRSKS